MHEKRWKTSWNLGTLFSEGGAKTLVYDKFGISVILKRYQVENEIVLYFAVIP